MKQSLKFKVGQKVNYILAGKVLFSGVIIEAEVSRGLKPYTIKKDDGSIGYANEEFLTVKES